MFSSTYLNRSDISPKSGFLLEIRKIPFVSFNSGLSKIDIDIDNAKYDGNDEKMVIPEIKGKIQKALQVNPELKDTKGIFLILAPGRS
jgi:hypothetical protein